MENVVVGCWLSVVYGGKEYMGQVMEVREWPKGRNILMLTENGYRTFYVNGLSNVVVQLAGC